MSFIAPIHAASSIRHAVKLRFLAPEQDCLAVAKSNRLEFYVQTTDGLSLANTTTIFGRISVLQRLVCPGLSLTDHLFVITDRHAYFTLSWDPSASAVRTERKYVDLFDQSARASTSPDRALIDPSRKYLTIEAYEGVITVLPIIQTPPRKKKSGGMLSSIAASTGGGGGGGGSSGNAEEDLKVGDLGLPIQMRVDEIFIVSSAFLYQRDAREPPRMAFLYEDTRGKLRLRIRDLTIVDGELELRPVEVLRGEMEAGSSLLIPVPNPIGGMLLLAETTIQYLDDRKDTVFKLPLQESTVFVSWVEIDRQRFLLADDYGKLYFLMLAVNEANDVVSWNIDCIGRTSHASVMVYMGGGFFFIGSHHGDSQLIRITQKAFEIMQTFTNIAPVLDFAVMDLGRKQGEAYYTSEFSSGQTRILAASGAFHDGSLRSVRSGVSIQDIGIVGPLQVAKNLFGVRTLGSEKHMDTLIVSLANHTRIFYFSANGEVEEKEQWMGLEMDENTLLAANLSPIHILQVSDHQVQVCDVLKGDSIWTWKPPHKKRITATSLNDYYLVVIIAGRGLLVFDVRSASLAITGQMTFNKEDQISGITLASEPPTACIACHPISVEVSVINVLTSTMDTRQALGEKGVHMPMSLVLAQMLPKEPPYLFVSMADGQVSTFNFDTRTSTLTKTGSVTFGCEQVAFQKLPRPDRLSNVFAACEQASLIYATEGRIVYSAVDSDKTTRICYLNPEAFPGAIAVATPDELKLATISTERQTQVVSLPVNETIIRLSHAKKQRAFGFGTIKRELENGVEVVSSRFVLADEVMFRKLSQHEMNQDELVSGVTKIDIPLPSDDDDDDDDQANKAVQEVFVVGTATLDDEYGNSAGRLLVFEVSAGRELTLVSEARLKSPCRALATMEGSTLIAALGKTVVVFKVQMDRFKNIRLTKKVSYITSTTPTDVAVHGDIIGVADLMKSISLVQYIRADAQQQDQLVELASHYQTIYTTAVSHAYRNTWLLADGEGNLIATKRREQAQTHDAKTRLSPYSEMNLGEMVNRIKPIDMKTHPNRLVSPRALLATVEGSIYVYGLINPQHRELFFQLQNAIAELVVSPGHLTFHKWRAFRNKNRQGDEPYNFVDFTLLESFLRIEPELQKEIVTHVNLARESDGQKPVDVGGVKGMVERLKI